MDESNYGDRDHEATASDWEVHHMPARQTKYSLDLA